MSPYSAVLIRIVFTLCTNTIFALTRRNLRLNVCSVFLFWAHFNGLYCLNIAFLLMWFSEFAWFHVILCFKQLGRACETFILRWQNVVQQSRDNTKFPVVEMQKSQTCRLDLFPWSWQAGKDSNDNWYPGDSVGVNRSNVHLAGLKVRNTNIIDISYSYWLVLGCIDADLCK